MIGLCVFAVLIRAEWCHRARARAHSIDDSIIDRACHKLALTFAARRVEMMQNTTITSFAREEVFAIINPPQSRWLIWVFNWENCSSSETWVRLHQAAVGVTSVCRLTRGDSYGCEWEEEKKFFLQQSFRFGVKRFAGATLKWSD
jgi:hypothetical protein